ncbi:sulfate adenylyltransferase [Planctomycetota bacterium]
MSELVKPHGGQLNLLRVEAEEAKSLLLKAKDAVKVKITSKEASDLIMMAMGAFSPLDGFMREKDYQGVVRDMHLADGTLWPIPITLAVAKDVADGLKPGQKIALTDPGDDAILALMTLEDKYAYDRKAEALSVFGTDDQAHPGVKKLYDQGDVYLGGPVKVLSEASYPETYPEYARCDETRAIFSEKGWKTVAAFQTRNPLHRSHEYLTKIALEVCDGLFIHPIVGKLKAGDIPAEVRMKCCRVLLEEYYPQERAVLKVYPMEMRYAGPKEAVLHAIIRQNFGCTHMIIGRDHAGVGDYYGAFDAQDIFDTFSESELAIKPLKLDWTFWCYKCGTMASMKTCPHTKDDRCLISGTKLRDMLAEGTTPPAEFSRPEVIEILTDYYQSERDN